MDTPQSDRIEFYLPVCGVLLESIPRFYFFNVSSMECDRDKTDDYGEILNFQVTPANVDDRKVVPKLTEGIVGKIFGDKGYISEKLSEILGLKPQSST